MPHITQHYQRGLKIILAMVAVGFLWMVFVAEGSNTGYTFATYGGQGKKGLELKIDSRAVYNGVLQPALTWDLKNLTPGVDHFFSFDDVKPGDMGEHTISLHVKKNNAYVCLDFSNLEDHENGENEPESLVDGVEGGELSQYLEFFAWRDDGDNKFEVGERVIFGTTTQTADVLLSSTTYAVADYNTGNSCKANSINYVGIIWCAGDLTVDVDTAEISCSGEKLGNIIQTDSMSVDLSLRAVQAKYHEKFTCVKKDKPKPKPEPECSRFTRDCFYDGPRSPFGDHRWPEDMVMLHHRTTHPSLSLVLNGGVGKEEVVEENEGEGEENDVTNWRKVEKASAISRLVDRGRGVVNYFRL